MKLTPARLALLVTLAIGAPYVLAASSGPTPSPTPDATPTVRGVVNTGAQSFAGAKTFQVLDAGYVVTNVLDAGTVLTAVGVVNSALQTSGLIWNSQSTNIKANGFTVGLNGSTGYLEATYGFNAGVGSGSNAFGVLVNGARVDLGTGASDYLYSDGTTVFSATDFAVPSGYGVTGDVYFSNAGKSGELWGRKTTGTGVILNNDHTLGSGDKLLSVRNNSAEKVFVSYEGTIQTAGGVSSTSASGGDAFYVTTNGARFHFGAGASDYATSDGTTVTFACPVHSTDTKTVGSITLSGGTGTATVISGAKCVCTDSTANASVKCAVSSTTLTATGTGTDVITYICL